MRKTERGGWEKNIYRDTGQAKEGGKGEMRRTQI